jgi:hypothetical protein
VNGKNCECFAKFGDFNGSGQNHSPTIFIRFALYFLIGFATQIYLPFPLGKGGPPAVDRVLFSFATFIFIKEK